MIDGVERRAVYSHHAKMEPQVAGPFFQGQTEV